MSGDPSPFDHVHTYRDDFELFRELGLPTFDLPGPVRGYEVGVVLLSSGAAVVRIALDALPSQFWKFCITNAEGHTSVYSTGSGPLSNYWPAVVLLATGMLKKDD